MRRELLLTSVVTALILCSAQPALSQTDPTKVPKPPTAELEKFRPYLGLYEHTMDFGGLQWSGTLDILPAVKGWYVEWVINTHHAQAIDRQLRMFMTWDPSLKKYRVWRFETLNPWPPEASEGVVRFEGNQLVMEWNATSPGGEPEIYRNRVTLSDPDLVIVTEFESANGRIQEIGVTRAHRRL